MIISSGIMDFLKTKDVAEKVYQGIIEEQEEVYIPYWHQLAFRVLHMLPARISDVLSLEIGNFDIIFR